MSKNPARSKRSRGAQSSKRNKRRRERAMRSKKARREGLEKARAETNRKRRAKAARRWDGCSGKKRYDDLDVAMDAAANLILSTKLEGAGVYLCGSGAPHYHVTSKPNAGCVVVLERDNP